MQEETPIPTSPAGGFETALSNMDEFGLPVLFFGLVAGIIVGYAIAYLQYAKKK